MYSWICMAKLYTEMEEKKTQKTSEQDCTLAGEISNFV